MKCWRISRASQRSTRAVVVRPGPSKYASTSWTARSRCAISDSFSAAVVMISSPWACCGILAVSRPRALARGLASGGGRLLRRRRNAPERRPWHGNLGAASPQLAQQAQALALHPVDRLQCRRRLGDTPRQLGILRAPNPLPLALHRLQHKHIRHRLVIRQILRTPAHHINPPTAPSEREALATPGAPRTAAGDRGAPRVPRGAPSAWGAWGRPEPPNTSEKRHPRDGDARVGLSRL